MTQPDARPYIWMLCGSFSFSIMAVLADSLTRRPNGASPLCDWQTVAVFRAALVTLFAAMLAKHAGVKLVWLRPWRLWVRSVAGSCSMVGTFCTFGHLHSEDVVTLSNTFPIWVAVLSWPMYGHLPGWKTLVAIGVGWLVWCWSSNRISNQVTSACSRHWPLPRSPRSRCSASTVCTTDPRAVVRSLLRGRDLLLRGAF